MEMSQVIKKFIFIHFLFLSCLAWAKNDLDKKLPSYQIFLDAQFTCSNKPIEPYKFVGRGDGEPFSEIAPKVWGVVKDSKLEEIENKPSTKGRARTFRWTYKRFGIFRCGLEINEFSKEGISTVSLPVIVDAFKKPGFFDSVNDIPTEERERTDIFFYDQVRDADSDQPVPEGKSGKPCLVKLEDILSDKNKINLDILCKNESKKNRDFTKKEIEKAISIWKSK